MDLAQIIGVDFNHIESKANEFVQNEPDVRIVLGQLISKYGHFVLFAFIC